jgi:hypothetical protein
MEWSSRGLIWRNIRCLSGRTEENYNKHQARWTEILILYIPYTKQGVNHSQVTVDDRVLKHLHIDGEETFINSWHITQ